MQLDENLINSLTALREVTSLLTSMPCWYTKKHSTLFCNSVNQTDTRKPGVWDTNVLLTWCSPIQNTCNKQMWHGPVLTTLKHNSRSLKRICACELPVLWSFHAQSTKWDVLVTVGTNLVHKLIVSVDRMYGESFSPWSRMEQYLPNSWQALLDQQREYNPERSQDVTTSDLSAKPVKHNNACTWLPYENNCWGERQHRRTWRDAHTSYHFACLMSVLG